MRKIIARMVVTAAVVQGCGPNPDSAEQRWRSERQIARKAAQASLTTQPSPVSPQTVIARVNGAPITMHQLEAPLVEAYGLNVLLNLVQLELAKQAAGKLGVSVSEQDFITERDRTLQEKFKDFKKEEYEQLLEQFLARNRTSRTEFDLFMRTNAYLRRMAEPMLAGKINDEELEQAFNVMYGEKVQVRHIQGSNPQEIQEARRRIEAGEKFEDVAVALSRNTRTAPGGGLAPEFSRATPDIPQAFKDTAFALTEGEISDIVQADNAYHILRLERRIPPKVIKLQDVKEDVRRQLHDSAVQATMKQLRKEIGQQALVSLDITHPKLNEQFQARNQQREVELKDRDALREKWEKEREQIAEEQSPATENN